VNGSIRVALVVTAAAGALAGGASSPAARTLGPCSGSMLTGSFRLIPGSPGAGNVVYRLKVAPAKGASCFVTGIPGLTLLDRKGHRLPTKATFAGRPGTLTAVMVPLSAGRSASLTARFSPDVPGPGEPAVGGACEPTAYKLRVTPSGGGSFVVPVSPATPVCEHGGLQISVFTRS
jgi:hypothetical protein